MNLDVPVLQTSRLTIRPFRLDDFEDVFRTLDVEIDGAHPTDEGCRAERQRWLEWTALSYAELARLYQPPSGDRAVVLTESGKLIGACGFVSVLNEFARIPYFRDQDEPEGPSLSSLEMGLYYAISPDYRRQGYAAEAARALVEFGFSQLQLKRIIATTSYDNAASQGVMRRLGMRLERNPGTEPPYLQVVGILENPGTNSPR